MLAACESYGGCARAARSRSTTFDMFTLLDEWRIGCVEFDAFDDSGSRE
jgi:hypothetical protein